MILIHSVLRCWTDFRTKTNLHFFRCNHGFCWGFGPFLRRRHGLRTLRKKNNFWLLQKKNGTTWFSFCWCNDFWCSGSVLMHRGTISLGFPGRQWHIASSSGIANGAIYGGVLLAKKAGEKLGGGFKYFYFHPYLGKIPILTNIFQRGWNHQLENVEDFYFKKKHVSYLIKERWWNMLPLPQKFTKKHRPTGGLKNPKRKLILPPVSPVFSGSGCLFFPLKKLIGSELLVKVLGC